MPGGFEGPANPGADRESNPSVLDAARALLRVTTPEEIVGVLIEFVRELGGTTVPARVAGSDEIPYDLSFGAGEPLVAEAPKGSPARSQLVALLPEVVKDAQVTLERMQFRRRLEMESIVDPLTGLLNRRGFERALQRAHDGDTVVAVDLDSFKTVNDLHGHEAGDDVLRELSRVLRAEMRVVDHPGRIGGDELAIVLGDTGSADGQAAIERVRMAWHAERVHAVGFSAGVAACRATGGEEALRRADEALYAAKRAGGDQTVVANSEPAHA